MIRSRCTPERLAKRDWMRVFVLVFMIGFVMLVTCISVYTKFGVCHLVGISGSHCTSLLYPSKENKTEDEKWCEHGVRLNVSGHRKKFHDCEKVKEEVEELMNPYFLKLTMIYFIPILIIAIPMGIIIDLLGFLRIRASVLSLVTVVSSIALLALYPTPTPDQSVYLAIPAGLGGGIIGLRLLAFSNVVKHENLLETFEKCAYIQGFIVGGQFLASLVAQLSIDADPLLLTKQKSQPVAALVLLLVASGMIPFIKSARNKEDESDEEHPAGNTVRMGNATSGQRIWFIGLSLTCVFFYYWCLIGESHEELEYMGEEAWYMVVLASYGSVSAGVKSILLVMSVFLYKKLADKLIINKRLVNRLNPAMLGLVGAAVDVVIKLILAFNRSEATKTIASICTVFGELVIVSSMSLIVSYVPDGHIGKFIGITALIEAICKILAGWAFRGIFLATRDWLEGFAFIYQIILLIVPIFCFVKMHLMIMSIQTEESSEAAVHSGTNIYGTNTPQYGIYSVENETDDAWDAQ